MSVDEFRAPIPGQSLTGAPGSMPWERPPEITDPEEVIQMYLTKLSGKKGTQMVLDLLEYDVDIRTMTEGFLRMGVSEGIHSIDASLIVAPVIHEFIKQTADVAGVEYDEGLEDKEVEAKRQRELGRARIRKMVKKAREKQGVTEEEMPVSEEAGTPMPEPEETASAGFMKRRGEL